MRLRRRLPIIFGVLVVAAAVAIVVVLRKHAPPEAARLLPQADGFLYINLRGLRRADLPGQLPPVVHDPEYEQFIQATGFQFENDLEEAAFAIHYPTGPAEGEQPRYSEVFVGKIQGERLRDYLRKISSSVENYRSTDIFSIPLQGRTLRVAVLGVDTVAASNQNDPRVVRGMIDRSRKLASPFGGPALLRKYYKYVPLADRYVPYASLCWAIFRVDPGVQGAAAGPFGLSFLFSKPAVVVASLRYLGTVHFRAEGFTDDEDEAKRVTEQLNTFLNVFRTAESTVGAPGPDPDVKKLFDSLKVQQSGDRAVLTAAVSVGFIRKALTGPPEMMELTPPTPEKKEQTPAHKVKSK
jgi:hypothetical protein